MRGMLQSRLDAAGLAVSGDSGTIPDNKVVLHEGLDGAGIPTTTLAATENATVFWLARPIVAETGRRLQILSILAAMGLIALFWVRQKRHMTRMAAAFGEIAAWTAALRSPKQRSPAFGPPTAPLGTSLTWTPDYAVVRDQVAAHSLLLADEKNAADREKEDLSTLLAEKDDHLIRCRQRLGELSELNTLGEQLKRTTRAFAEHVHNVRDAFEDLQSILSSGLRHESRQLVALADRWAAGLRERGARKFIRSLAETQGTTTANSALDDEIGNLQVTSQAITDLALNASMHAQKLVQSVDHTAEVAALWDQLAHRKPAEDSADSIASWKDILASLQRLMKMDTKLAPFKVSDYIAEADAATIPRLPATVWTSTLYHACLAAFDSRWLEQNGLNPTLAFRLRQTPNRIILVISVRLPDKTPLLSPSSEQTYNLDVAQALLEPYGLDAACMPVVHGAAPIAISWAPALSISPARTHARKSTTSPVKIDFAPK